MADTNPWASRLKLRRAPAGDRRLASRVAVVALLTALILTVLAAAGILLRGW